MAVQPPPELRKAIEDALDQVRVELFRLYADGDVGKIEVNCGKARIVVKALPERINEPVQVKAE